MGTPMAAANGKGKGNVIRENERKWTRHLLSAGFMMLPTIILHRQRDLGLNPVDVNILLQLISHWWRKDNLPHPSKRTIADRLGIDPSTVRRHIAAMEKRRLITRVERQNTDSGRQSNYYDLRGLVRAARPYADEVLKARKAKGRKGSPAAERK
jgi:DNA-binding transcriptional ArsR family regulator